MSESRTERRATIRHAGWVATLWTAAKTPRGAIGLALTLFVVLVAAIGPLVAPYSGQEFVTTPYAPPSVSPSTYVIDGKNRRVSQLLAGTAQRSWVYDDQLRIAAELDGTASGKFTHIFAYGEGGTPEMVADGLTGLLVPPADVAALTGAIAALLADPARGRAMGQAGRARVAQLFSLEATVRATGQLYERLLWGASASRQELAGRPEPARRADPVPTVVEGEWP